jgi:hypothetical protein
MKTLLLTAAAVALFACSSSSSTTGNAPTITAFTASPTTLPDGGGSVTLAWSVTGASTLSISNGVGAVTPATSGSTRVTLSTTTTFTLTATAPGGTSTATANVTVGGAPTTSPTITTFTASPTTLSSGGGSVTLAWNVTGASTLSIDNGVGAVSPATVGSTSVAVTDTTPFTLTAMNSVGTSTATATVTVGTAPPTIQSFTASPATLPAGGGNVTLAWNVTGATSLALDVTTPVTPLTSGTFNSTATRSGNVLLAATNANGTTLANAWVTVGEDNATGFIGTYGPGIWGFAASQEGVVQPPPGSNVVTSINILETATNVVTIDIAFDTSGTWTGFSCSGNTEAVTDPNFILQGATDPDAGFVCQVTGDATCGNYALNAPVGMGRTFGLGFYDTLTINDPDVGSDPLRIVWTFTTSDPNNSSCDNQRQNLVFLVPQQF